MRTLNRRDLLTKATGAAGAAPFPWAALKGPVRMPLNYVRAGTLAHELDRLHAQADTDGKRAVGWLVRLIDRSDDFHCAALTAIELLLDDPQNPEVREFAQQLYERRDLVGHAFTETLPPA